MQAGSSRSGSSSALGSCSLRLRNNKSMVFMVVLLLTLVMPSHASTNPNIVRVDPTLGDDTTCAPGGSACRTIGRGLEVAVANGIVMVAPGTYSGKGNCNVAITRPVTLTSSRGQSGTIWDCEHKSRCLQISANATVEGFTFQRGFVGPIANCTDPERTDGQRSFPRAASTVSRVYNSTRSPRIPDSRTDMPHVDTQLGVAQESQLFPQMSLVAPHVGTAFLALLMSSPVGVTSVPFQSADGHDLEQALQQLSMQDFVALRKAVLHIPLGRQHEPERENMAVHATEVHSMENNTIQRSVASSGWFKFSKPLSHQGSRSDSVRSHHPKTQYAPRHTKSPQASSPRSIHAPLARSSRRHALSIDFNDDSLMASAGGCILVDGMGIRVSIAHSTIIGGIAPRGGGITFNGAHAVLSNVLVASNNAEWGGGLLAIGGTLQIISSAISNNSVVNRGPVVTWPNNAAVGAGAALFHVEQADVRNTSITGNKGTSCGQCEYSDCADTGLAEASGGGISCSGGIVSVSSSHVTNNGLSCSGSKCLSAGGGILSYRGIVSVSSSHVTNNRLLCSGSQCLSVGGGIYIVGSVVVVSSSHVTCNSMMSYYFAGGGGIGSSGGGSVLMYSSRVTNNTLTGPFCQGGGIYSEPGSDSGGMISVSSSHLRFNSLNGYDVFGGGIYSSGGIVSVTSSHVSNHSLTCTGSQCDSQGGGMFIDGDVKLSLSSSHVTSNSLSCSGPSICTAGGGGIFVTNGGNASISSSHVTNNVLLCSAPRCLSAGGGLMSVEGGFISVSSSHLAANDLIAEGTSHGGGMFLFRGIVSVSSSNVTSNYLRANFSRGGGIFIRSCNVSVSSSHVTNNFLSSSGSDRISHEVPVALGGGVWTCCGAVLSLWNISVAMNRLVCGGSVQGGGLWLSNSSGLQDDRYQSTQVRAREISISQNILMGGDTAGGAVYASGFSDDHIPVSLQGCILGQNTLLSLTGHAAGGGVHLVQSVLVMIHCDLSHNNVSNGWVPGVNATAIGGGVAVLGDKSRSTLGACRLAHNSAGVNNAKVGSGRGNGEGCTLAAIAMPRTVLADNSASGEGGGVFLSTTARFSFSGNATNNVAASLGGTLFSAQDTGGSGHLFIKGFTVAAAVVVPPLLSAAVEFEHTSVVCSKGSGIQVTDERASRLVASVSATNDTDAFPTYETVQVGSSVIKVFAVQCARCPPGSYSLSGQSSTDNRTGSFCRPCPFGGDCSSGGPNILATHGFWGNADTSGEVSFTRCPLGYCCKGRSCPLSFCEGGRDGALFGGCASGTGNAFFTTRCVRDDNCHDASWAIPLLIVAIVLYGGFLVIAPISKTNTGVFSVIVFFYQVLPLVRGEADWEQARDSFIFVVESVMLGGVSRSGEGSGVRGICVVPGMSAVLVVTANYLLPDTVCFMIGCWWLVSQLPWAQASMRSAPSECWSKALRNLHQTSPVLVAGLRLLLLSYSNLVATSFSLLTCRTLAGSDQRVIFRQGTSSCPMTWQLAPLLLAILMTLIPLALVSWVRRNREQHPNAVASLCSVFAPGHQHWFAVLLYQRWLMTLIYAFIFSPLWRGLLQALLCAANLLLGVGQRPFRGQKAQALYTTSLALLLIIAVLALPSQIKASLASTESLGNHVDNRRALAGLQFVAALLPGCLVAVWFAATKFWPRLRHWSRKPQVRLENHFENELMDDPSPWVTA